jgi:hypothetical protein
MAQLLRFGAVDVLRSMGCELLHAAMSGMGAQVRHSAPQLTPKMPGEPKRVQPSRARS